MFKIICVTNRKMCSDLEDRAETLHKYNVPVILREKDLSCEEYTSLARKVLQVCPDVILHTYTEAAQIMEVKRIHMPLGRLDRGTKKKFDLLGVSVHSPEEAVRAQELGADYVIAGHIFKTDCKKGVEPRGVEFLEAAVKSVNIPVYAIGGITPDNIKFVKKAGAAGVCVMSGFMQCDSAEEYYRSLLWGL